MKTIRKDAYYGTIKKFSEKLLSFYDEATGCFFYPYWQGKTGYANARWQEGVATLAWLLKKENNPSLMPKISKGIDFWCALQHRNGSFPEYSKHDVSFSATAFSLIAITEAIKNTRFEERWIPAIHRAADWLSKNDELVFTNQAAAAALALLMAGTLLKDASYADNAEKKLKIVLGRQDKSGYYLEKKGFDFGYSTLTLEMLGHIHMQRPTSDILASAQKFIDLVLHADRFESCRGTGWAIVDGFEIFAGKCRGGTDALKKILEKYSFTHLENESNLCTDMYRLCWAHDNATTGFDCNVKPVEPAALALRRQPSKLLNLFRPIGLHRLRKYLW